jgi:hypothetical protein
LNQKFSEQATTRNYIFFLIVMHCTFSNIQYQHCEFSSVL